MPKKTNMQSNEEAKKRENARANYAKKNGVFDEKTGSYKIVKDSGKNTSANKSANIYSDIIKQGKGPVAVNSTFSRSVPLSIGNKSNINADKKKEQYFSASPDFLRKEEAKRRTQESVEHYQKSFDETAKKLGEMRYLNSIGRGYKIYSDEEIATCTSELEAIGNILSGLYEERGESDKMYDVRSRVSSAVLKNVDEETPRSIQGVSIPQSLRQQISPKLDDAVYRKKANDIAKKYVSKEYTDSGNEVSDFFNYFGANFSSGKIGEASGDSGYAYASNPTEARKYYKETVEDIMNTFLGRNNSTVGKGGIISKNLATYLPQLEGQVKNSLPLALIGAAIGAAVGAPGIGFKLGFSAGSGRYSYEQMYGTAFNNLSNITDFETAKSLARDEGLVSGGVETLDTLGDIALLGGGAVLKALGKETTEKIAKTSLFKLLGGYSLSVIGEGGQESVQELISIANERRAKKGSANSGVVGLVGETVSLVNEIFRGENDAALRRAKEAGIEGMKTAAVVGGPSLAVNTALANKLSENSIKPLKENTNEEDVYYLIDENFEQNYDKWVNKGRNDGVVLTVGRTSEALRSIDVKEQSVTWDTSNINRSLNEHSYLDDSIMKQIPSLLENPIIVMQSKKSDSRITMFGEVYDKDGLPIMAVLELAPVNRKGTAALDVIKITSTHSRKSKNPNKPADITQTQSMINTSEILYVEPNKKRTDNWLVANRLQLPLHVTNYGSIKSVTYPDGNVNTYDMQDAQNNNKNVDAFDEILAQGTNEYAVEAKKRIAQAQGESNNEVLYQVRDEDGNVADTRTPLKSDEKSGKMETNNDSGLQNNLHNAVNEFLSNVNVRKVKMKVFPSYNESRSDANERATRWAHDDNVQTKAQKLAWYLDRWYVIEKFDSMEEGYQIIGAVPTRAMNKFIDEVKKNEQTAGQRDLRRVLDRITVSDKTGSASGLRGYSSDNSSVEFGRENTEVRGLDKEQDAGRTSSGDHRGNTEYDSADRATRVRNVDAFDEILAQGTNEYAEDARKRIAEAQGNNDSGKIEGTDGSQYRTMWTIADNVLTKQDVALVYRDIENINNRNSDRYEISADGDYILEINNKLVYTDADSDYPTVTSVITFGSEYEDDISLAKELILNEERSQSSVDNAFEVIEAMYGQGFVSRTYIEDSSAYAQMRNGGREGSSGRKVDSRSGKNVDDTDILASIEDKPTGELSGVTATDIESGNIPKGLRVRLGNFQKVMARMGFKVIYESHRNTPDNTIGYVDFTNREVYLSPEHIDEALLTHELTHVIDKGFSGKYVKSLISFFKNNLASDWDKKYKEVKTKYENIAEANYGFTYTDSTLEAETLAEMCSDFTTDEYIRKAANMEVGTIKQIGVLCKYIGAKLNSIFFDKTNAQKFNVASLKWQLALYKATKRGESESGRGVLFAKSKNDWWRPDLSRRDLDKLMQIINNDIKTSVNSITDTANWLFTNVNGTRVFAIYSTENTENPTLLYESRDNRAISDRDKVLRILEVCENVRSVHEISGIVDRVFGGIKMRQSGYSGNNIGVAGRGSGSGNAEVLSRKPRSRYDRVLESVLRNLFEIQGRDGGNGINFSASNEDFLFSFAGPKAEGYNKSLYRRAVNMEKKGATPYEIWEKTGWAKGQDGKWRFEIDDSKALFSPRGRFRAGAAKEGTLSAYLKHNKLYKAYPFLRDIKVEIDDSLPINLKGLYNYEANTIKINGKLSLEEQLSSALHEVQHAIQHYEGFAKGASTEFWDMHPVYYPEIVESAKKKVEEVESKFLELPDGEYYLELAEEYFKSSMTLLTGKETQERLNEIQNIMEKAGIGDVLQEYFTVRQRLFGANNRARPSSDELYYNTAGEIESRDVQKRRHLSKEQRRENFPKSFIENPDVVFVEDYEENAVAVGHSESSVGAESGGRIHYRNADLTNTDLNEYLNVGRKQHTRNKKMRMLDSGKNPILTTSAEIKKFISDVIQGNAQGEVRAFGKVGKRLSDAISDKRSNLDLYDSYIEINADDIREAYKMHSEPKENGDIPLTEKDFEKIPEYLNNFTGVLGVNTHNEKVEIHIYTQTDDGYIRILTVASKERSLLQVTKLIGVSKDKFEQKYAKKIERDIGSLRSQEDSNPSTTAQHTADALSDISISQNGENFNKKISTNDDLLMDVMEEISIIDEALKDKSLPSADRVALIKDKVRLKRQLNEGRDVHGQEDTPRTKGLEDAVLAYRESGDASGIPTRRSVAASKKYYDAKASDIEAELKQIDEALSDSENLSDMEYDELCNRRDALLTQWREAAKKNSVLSQVFDILDEIDTAARPNHTWVNDIVGWLADKKNLIKYGTYNLNDIERNFKMFFGEHFKKAYDKIIQPLYDSKKAYTEGVMEYAGRLKKEIVDGLGIKKGSKESAAVMWLGEGKKPQSLKAGSDLADYTYKDCVAEFGEDVAGKIQKATEIFREMYDDLLAQVNETRAMLYPNNSDKLIPKRTDYFRHFQEMSQGFEGLKNILQTNIGIDPMLVGVSENTKPKSKWQSLAQSRTGNRTTYDAVGGFLDYLPAVQYSIHIDPNIVNIRSLAYDLASAKAKENNGSGNPNANGFIAYLQKYANSLAGKTTSHFDRAIQDSNFGRTAMAIVSWLNNKTKASAVLGNINSVLSQFTNVVNMVGKIEHQEDVVRGALDALAGLNLGGRIAKRYEDSGFLKERYLDRVFSQFDRGWDKVNPVKWAADLLGFADEIGTRITWNAAYNEATRKNIKNPVQYADNFTRACVAGRGIGEEALVFRSQVAKMFLPFRTETLNNIRVQQDILFGEEYDIWEKSDIKITPDMTETQRYNVLKHRTVKVTQSKSLVTENVTKEDIKRLETKYKSEAKGILAKLRDDFGVLKDYSNEDIELDFEFSKRSFGESVTKQKKNYVEFAKMLTCFDEVVKNAVGIEVHSDKYANTERADTTLKQSYVLASVFSDGKEVYPVKLLVKEFNDGKKNKLHVAIVPNKKEGTISTRTLHKENATFHAPIPSNISLAQLLDIVNDEDFDKYIPKQFKNDKKQDAFEEIVAMGKADGSKIKTNTAKRVKNMMQLYVATMVVNAVIAAIKSDEFEPLEEAKEGFEENGALGALLSVMEDYADGIGDPVAFDPIYDIASGIYQGVNEGESADGDVGRAALRSAQNLAGDLVSNNPFSTAVMGMVGFDNEASELLFNGNVYVPGGMGMPLASNAATVMRELGQGDYATAAATAVKSFLPMGTQFDRSAKGVYDWYKGYATTETAYDRIVGQDGDLKYLIEKTPETFIKSLLFGPGAFSGESDAYYNDKTRKFTDEEQAEILSHNDYKSRKVTFDDIVAMREYNGKKDERKQSAADGFFQGKEGTILHNLYMSGVDEAVPYKNMAEDASFTDSKTGKKYTLNLKADELNKLTGEVSDKIAERFNRANESDVFAVMSQDEQVKYLKSVADAEYKQAKIKALYDSGQMEYGDYFRLESNYIEAEAKRDRVLYIDDVSAYINFNAADTVGQYIAYSDFPLSGKGYEQLSAWRDYSSTRKPDDVDKELMRLSNETGSDINVSGNPYGVISYTKKGVDYKIEMPDNQIYALCDEVDKAVRSALLSLFATASYKNAAAAAKKDMVSDVKSDVRAGIKSKYKARYSSVKVDDFDRIINMK